MKYKIGEYVKIIGYPVGSDDVDPYIGSIGKVTFAGGSPILYQIENIYFVWSEYNLGKPTQEEIIISKL